MIKSKTGAILAICSMLLTTACSKDDKSSPKVTDQDTAEKFAWGVESAFRHAAPSGSSQTWANTTVSGYATGSALVSGSFTDNYNSMTGRSDETYSNVVINFTNFSDDSYFPTLTGTVMVSGTCTTIYGMSTSYSGQWNVAGTNLSLSGTLSGTASISMAFRRGGLDWAAVVESPDGSWSVSNSLYH